MYFLSLGWKGLRPHSNIAKYLLFFLQKFLKLLNSHAQYWVILGICTEDLVKLEANKHIINTATTVKLSELDTRALQDSGDILSTSFPPPLRPNPAPTQTLNLTWGKVGMCPETCTDLTQVGKSQPSLIAVQQAKQQFILAYTEKNLNSLDCICPQLDHNASCGCNHPALQHLTSYRHILYKFFYAEKKLLEFPAPTL